MRVPPLKFLALKKVWKLSKNPKFHRLAISKLPDDLLLLFRKCHRHEPSYIGIIVNKDENIIQTMIRSENPLSNLWGDDFRVFFSPFSKCYIVLRMKENQIIDILVKTKPNLCSCTDDSKALIFQPTCLHLSIFENLKIYDINNDFDWKLLPCGRCLKRYPV